MQQMIVRRDNIKCPLHINAELEIVYVKQGTLTVNTDVGQIELFDNEAVLILPYRLHGFEPQGNADVIVMMFPHSVIDGFDVTYSNSGFFKMTLNSNLKNYAEDIILSKNYDVLSSKSVFYAFASEFVKLNNRVAKTQNCKSVVREIIAYVSDRVFCEDITLTDISKALHINKNAVSNVFKDYIGVSPAEFVKTVRLQRSLTLLANPEISVTDVAYRSGFGSIRSFNRVFFETMHCTPTEYRKKNYSEMT